MSQREKRPSEQSEREGEARQGILAEGATQAPIKLLAIETSGVRGSVALWAGGELVGESLLNPEQRTVVSLLPTIRELLGAQSYPLHDLDALAVSLGPGSYTGTRIGLACAQGLAGASGLPVYGFSSLVVLAASVTSDGQPVAVLRPARSGEFFFAVFAASGQELFPEGRHQEAAIVQHLEPFSGRVLLETESISAPWTRFAAQSVRAQARDLARLAAAQDHRTAVPLGLHLALRHSLNSGPFGCGI